MIKRRAILTAVVILSLAATVLKKRSDPGTQTIQAAPASAAQPSVKGGVRPQSVPQPL